MHICIRVHLFAHMNEIVISVPCGHLPMAVFSHSLWTLLTATEDSHCVDATLSASWFLFNCTLPASQVTVTRRVAAGIRADLKMEPCPMQLS